MKRWLSMLVVFAMVFTMIPVMAHADGLSDKLLAAYNFDDQTTNDSAGSNNAVFYNNASAATATYTDGIHGKALQLSAKDTDQKYWLSIPMSALDGKDSFTLSLWYNQTGKNTGGEDSELFSFYNSSAEKFLYYTTATTGGSNGFTMKWAGSGTYGYANSYDLAYAENEWVHLAYVVNVVSGQPAISVYKNGALTGMDQGGEWSNSLLSELGVNMFTIGGKNPYKGGATPNCLFYGAVDEIEIYDGALSASEISEVYANALRVDRGTLLAEYNFDNQDTTDNIGTNDATLYNNATAATAVFTDGISGKALQLSTKDAAEKYWLSVPMAALSGQNSFTISMWYNQTGKNTSGEDSELFSFYNSSAEKFLYYSTAGTGMTNGFTMKWDGNYGFANSYGFPYAENEWTHLTYVVDIVNDLADISVYRNGVLVGTEQGGNWTNGLLSEFGANMFTIGGKNPYKGGATPNCLFYGAVDEVKLYAGALTAEEAAAIYQAEKPQIARGTLLAEYNFDNQDTTDNIGTNDATMYNNATAATAVFTDGVSGKALQLSTKDAAEKYWLDVPMAALSGLDSFTISMWYNQTGKNTSGEDSELFSFYNSGAEKFLYYTTATTGGSNGFTMKWDGTYGFANSYGFPYAENEWTYLTYVVDIVNDLAAISVYRNGELVGTEQGSNWTNGLLSELGVNKFTIGGKNPYKGGATPNCLFYGAVDEVKLYAGALTAEEASAIYEAEKPAPAITLDDGYYLIGPDWTIGSIDASKQFTVNPGNANEFMLSTSLAVGDEIKVVHVANNAIDGWYPDGLDNQYHVGAEHSGYVTIYFKTTYDGNWSAFGGYFYIDAGKAAVTANSISLKDEIGVNFYIWLPDGYTADNTEVSFAWGAGDSAHTAAGTLTATTSYDANYRVSCSIAARHMTDAVTMTVTSGGETILTDAFSVVQYAERAKASYAENTELMQLLCDMLDYGGAVQDFFGYATDDLASSHIATINAEWTRAAGTASLTDSTAIPNDTVLAAYGLKYEYATMVATSKTAIRLYFSVTDAATFANTKATLGTNELSFRAKGEYQILEISGIAAKNIFDTYTIALTNGMNTQNIVYSAANYYNAIMNQTASEGDTYNVAKLQAVLAAMYRYYVSAGNVL